MDDKSQDRLNKIEIKRKQKEERREKEAGRHLHRTL